MTAKETFEEEEQEIKQETNYEHFKYEIIENSGFCFALADGKPCQCSDISCSECGFSTGHGCSEKGYFKCIDTSIPIHEILDNCEVIK